MLTPITNLPISWQKAISPVKSGTTCSVCSASWTFHTINLAISAQPAPLRPCRKVQYSKKDQGKMNEWLRNQNQCGIWCRRLSIGPQQRFVRVHLTVWGLRKQKVQIWIWLVQGNLYPEIRMKTQHRDLKWGNLMQIRALMQGKLVTETTKNPIGTGPSHHNMTISRNYVGHLEKVSNVRQKRGRQPEDDMPEIDVNMMIWRKCMPATMKAAVHLG